MRDARWENHDANDCSTKYKLYTAALLVRSSPASRARGKALLFYSLVHISTHTPSFTHADTHAQLQRTHIHARPGSWTGHSCRHQRPILYCAFLGLRLHILRMRLPGYTRPRAAISHRRPGEELRWRHVSHAVPRIAAYGRRRDYVCARELHPSIRHQKGCHDFEEVLRTRCCFAGNRKTWLSMNSSNRIA